MLGLLIFFGFALAVLLTVLTAMLVREMRHPPRHTTAYALARGLPCDPGDLQPPLAFEEWWLERPDGAALPVWDMVNPKSKSPIRPGGIQITDPPRRNPKSLTAVFVHGWGHSRIDILLRVNVFLPFCDRIIVYDLRGHGESRQCKSNLGDGEDDDLLALMERLGDESLVLIGHSMGAVVAIKAAAKAIRLGHPMAKRIRGIVAYGAYCEFHDSLHGRLRAAGYPGRPITDLAMIVHRLSGVKPLCLTENDVAELHCSLLMFHGVDDAVAPISHARRLVAAAGGAALHEMEGAQHSDAHTINAAAHDERVSAFMQSVQETTNNALANDAAPTAVIARANAPPPPR